MVSQLNGHGFTERGLTENFCLCCMRLFTSIPYFRLDSLKICFMEPNVHGSKLNKLPCYSSLIPRPIPSFSMLHAEKREGLVSEITCLCVTLMRRPAVEKVKKTVVGHAPTSHVNFLAL